MDSYSNRYLTNPADYKYFLWCHVGHARRTGIEHHGITSALMEKQISDQELLILVDHKDRDASYRAFLAFQAV